MKDFSEIFTGPIEIIQKLSDEKTALKYLEKWRWPDGIRCPHCGFDTVHRYKTRAIFWCKSCNSQFSVKAGTIFEGSRLPMVKWFLAIYYNGCHKKGISSHQLAKDIHVTQKTAWFMLQRIRQTMKQSDEKLEDVVEIDEAFIGGKNKNRHIHKKVKYGRGREYKDKVPVFGMVQRTGKAKVFVVPKARNVYIQPLVRQHVKKGSLLCTDEWDGYHGLDNDYIVGSINHSKKRYRDGEISTNRMEGFWTQLKRALYGIYHRVSPKYLQRYVDEITFRYNVRKLKQGEVFNMIMSNINTRITYKQLRA